MDLISSPPPPVDIRLSAHEASLLLALVQNGPDMEPLEFKELRQSLFEVLKEGLTRN